MKFLFQPTTWVNVTVYNQLFERNNLVWILLSGPELSAFVYYYYYYFIAISIIITPAT